MALLFFSCRGSFAFLLLLPLFLLLPMAATALRVQFPERQQQQQQAILNEADAKTVVAGKMESLKYSTIFCIATFDK